MPMRKTTKKVEETYDDLIPIEQHTATFLLIGTSPMLYNAVSAKARRELLFPAPKKNAAARQQNLKHDPLSEYRNSVYVSDNPEAPTRLVFPSRAFKKAMATAALDIPGATKAAVGRLSWVPGDKIAIYGVPKLHMGVVRSADFNKTPDIRTRAILEEWCCAVRVNWVEPQLNQNNVVKLLGAAGLLCGIGDFRQEKGAGSYGQYRIADGPDDPELIRIMNQGGRAAQIAAMQNPVCYDEETFELYSWFNEEVERRHRGGSLGKDGTGSDIPEREEEEFLHDNVYASREAPAGEEDGIDLRAALPGFRQEAKRRGRKPAVKPVVIVEEEPVAAAPKRRGRPPKAATAAVAAKTTTAKRGNGLLLR